MPTAASFQYARIDRLFQNNQACRLKLVFFFPSTIRRFGTG
ncbi:hypothetical protein BUC_4216 [Burkholderia pseudomallei 576]|nr:hypothetical protein BUC_4216 [Burkholderia pseudomallei 576]